MNELNATSASNMLTNTYTIEGLDCANCAAKLEKKLLALPGVIEASINFGAAKLTVKHTTTTDVIVSAIINSGYSITGMSAITKANKPWWRNIKILSTTIAGLCLATATLMDVLNIDAAMTTLLYILTMLIGGYYVAKSGLYSLRSFILDSNFLMSIAAIGAAVIGEWSEGATAVFLFSLGNTLQGYTMDKTRESIRAMMELSPQGALVRRNGAEIKLAVENILIDDIIIVKPGERIAMDGIVVSGISAVNQAAITGESLPIEKNTGDNVYAGTINEHGVLEIRVTALYQESTIAKIMHMVEQAQTAKAPMQQFVDVFAKYYTPAIIIGALLLMFIPWLVYNEPFSKWFYRALVLLVISCPCALVISTPVSIVSAIGNASRNGILIKGGIYLEELNNIKVIAFDKTGTLTNGRPVVTDIIPFKNMDNTELLITAASIEKHSEHPIAQAVVTKANNLTLQPIENFKSLIGQGAQADINGQTFFIGNARLFEQLGHDGITTDARITTLEQSGKTVMLLGTSNIIYGLIAVADTLRDITAIAIQSLRNTHHSHLAMLTGDNTHAAKTIASELTMDSYYSELLPQDKVAIIEQLTTSYGSTLMIGDGVNDAPALASAKIGIAMGSAGSDTALETADISLMNDDLNKLPYLFKLSRKTLRIIKQNIIFSLVLKAFFIIATFLGMANLWMAVLADTGAALIVIANGMRLMRNL